MSAGRAAAQRTEQRLRCAARAVLCAVTIGCGGATSPNDSAPPPTTPSVPAVPTAPAAPVVGTVPGRLYFGTDSYVEYAAGELPIILSAPHGGEMTPGALPDRTEARCAADDDFSTLNDTNTQPLARLVADSLRAQTGRQAHLVIARLARRKLDANRDSLAASCGDAAAGRAWHEYHLFLDSARAAVARTATRGLYVDLHGHAHPVARIELGYLLRGADLDRTDATLNASASYEQASSIRALSEASPLSFAALLRGPTSLGALLAARGYAAVPSPDAPGPNGAAYFNGGYDTVRHGCRDGGVVCGVQAELPFVGVRDTDASRERFAGQLARALVEYLRTHAGATL